MNNLKTAGVFALIAIFTFSMVFVPFTPTRSVQPVANHDSTTPEDVLMDIQKYVDTQREGGPIGSILASYRDTGYIPNTVAINDNGYMGVLVTVKTESDVDSLDQIIDVNWKVKIGAMTVASGFITSPEAVTALENFDGIVTAFADSLYEEKTTGVEPRPTMSPPTTTEPEDLVIDTHIGADQVWAAGYDGTGVTVGVIDTGTDFSHEGLVGTMAIGSDGLSMSYDPTGYGFGVNLYRANATVVENVTAWLGWSSWNMLSYKGADGKWYLNWSTCQHGSPYVNNQGGLSNLDWFVEAYLPAWWPNGYKNEGNLTNFYNTVMRQDQELPDPTVAGGGSRINYSDYTVVNATTGERVYHYVDTVGVPYYCTGYVFQQRGDPYAKIFAPTLVLNNTILVVDWNTTRAHTDFWNANINYGIWDFNTTAAWDYYTDMGDWSFVDDLEDGLTYYPSGSEANLNIYYDYSDGYRFGLGTLAHCWENNIFGLGMVDGIGLSGRALGIIYDGDSHGTFVAGEIAGQPTSYPIGLNGTSGTIEGIAPDAKIMAVMTVGIASEFSSMLYAAGFDYNYTSEYWEWNYESAHTAQITSNSWGWVAPQYLELWGQYSLIYAAMATPGFFNATHYPGMVQCFSAGNSGPGYGTTTPPRAPQIINVGASTSYHTFDNSYGPGQGFDQIADFSSRGPLTLGYPKPDVLAPGRNNYGFVPYYGQVILGPYGLARDEYSVYAGTSMACPLAAGLAALMLDADSALTPDMVKVIMQNTADDIGMDGLSQGHGVINAFAAVDYVANGNGNVFYTYDSADNWVTATTEAWQYDMNPYTVQTFINTTIPPGNFADGNLYFGLVEESDVGTINVMGDYGTYADWTWTDAHYIADQKTTFTFETFIYNETTSLGHNRTLAGWFDLNTMMEAASTGSYTNFQGADYATISIAGDIDALGTWYDSNGNAHDDLWAFVFNWNDNDPANGIPDYYNMTTGEGDELTRLQYAGSSGNVLKMDLSSPAGLGSLFPNTPIISVHDDTIWSWPYTSGNTVTVTVQTWTLVDDANINVAENAGTADVTLTVAPGTDYGIHEGFVIATNVGDPSIVEMLPYTYNVFATYDTEATVMEVTEGIGAVQTPYEHGTVTAGWDSYYTSRSADHMSFVVNMTDATVNYLAARINWTNAETDMDVAIVDMTGSELAFSGDAVKSTTDSSLAIAKVDGTTGMYIIYTSLNLLAGTDIPEVFTLTVVGLASIDEPTLALSWTSRTNPTPTAITTGGSAVGDHVEMTATWTDGVNPGMPEFGITTVEMKILYGNLFTADGPLPQGVPDPSGALRESPVNPDYFAWETAPGIGEGDDVRIVLDFDGGDVDAIVWWADTPAEDLDQAHSITGADMATGDKPQVYDFTADRDGDLLFGILDWAQDGAIYHLSVDTRLGLEPARAAGNVFTMDTYYLLANQTYSILVDSDTGTNLRYSEEIPGIFIGNFFAPDVTVNAPVDLGSNSFNLTWSVTDQNADDVHYYSVWLSADGGVSYQAIIRNLTTPYYVWDSSGFIERDNYIVRVRAFSLDFSNVLDLLPAGHPDGVYDTPLCSADSESDYWPGDFTDAFTGEFSAGDVPAQVTTTPTTPTTPTGPTGPTTPVTWDPLLIGLIGGIGVGVVVLLILFLIRKK